MAITDYNTQKRLLDTLSIVARLYDKLNGVNALWRDLNREKDGSGWVERHDHLK